MFKELVYTFIFIFLLKKIKDQHVLMHLEIITDHFKCKPDIFLVMIALHPNSYIQEIKLQKF